MNTKLIDIAEIILGYPFRGKIAQPKRDDKDKPEVRVIQIKDITNHQANLPEKLTTSFVDMDYNKFLVKKNDLVMPVRGGNYFAERITQVKEPTIAVSHVFIIRCKEKILPAYLYWYLNLTSTQHILKQGQTGSNITMLNKATLGNLKIELPSIAKQEKIAGLQSLWAKQKQTYEQLIENGDLFTQGLCQNLLESTTHAE